MTPPTDHDAEQALREMLSGRIGALTAPTGVYEAVRRRHRHRRNALVGGTAAVAAATAVAVPTLALRDRPDRAPTATSTGAPPTGILTRAPDDPVSCTGWEAPRTPAPGLPAQSGVLGSLGGDEAAVTAVLNTGWAALAGENRVVGLNPATAVVRLVERTEAGLVVGVVGATGSGGSGRVAVVSGQDLQHLYAMTGNGGFQGEGGSEPPDGVMIQQAAACQPAPLVVTAPPGSVVRVSWITGIAADLSITRPHVDFPVRPDGVAAIDRPAPDETITIDVVKDGRTLQSTWITNVAGPDPVAPSAAAISAALAAAPGEAGRRQALTILRQQFTQVPVDQSGVRVWWKGTTESGWTVTAAVTTLPGGARYVWGGSMKTPGDGIQYFDGLLAADQADRTALAFRLPVPGSPLAVLFPGTARVRLDRAGGTTETRATGGLTVADGAAVTGIRVLDARGRELRVVDARTGLTMLPSPSG